MIDVSKLQPGELFVVPDEEGCWGMVLQYVRPDDNDPNRVIGLSVEDNKYYAVRKDMSCVPRVLGPEQDGGKRPRKQRGGKPKRSPAGGRARRTGDDPITADQRRMLFGLGKSRGLDIDDLRAMTPAGSISALTKAEAGRLIDRLTDTPGWSEAHEGRGTATSKQLGLIEHLRTQIGFADSAFNAWLHRQFKIGSVAEIDDRGLASRVIGALLGMQRNLHGARTVNG